MEKRKSFLLRLRPAIFGGLVLLLGVTWNQGDRMSLWKKRTKRSPTRFLPKLVHNFNRGKK
jgi:hypothetical protein